MYGLEASILDRKVLAMMHPPQASNAGNLKSNDNCLSLRSIADMKPPQQKFVVIHQKESVLTRYLTLRTTCKQL